MFRLPQGGRFFLPHYRRTGGVRQTRIVPTGGTRKPAGNLKNFQRAPAASDRPSPARAATRHPPATTIVPCTRRPGPEPCQRPPEAWGIPADRSMAKARPRPPQPSGEKLPSMPLAQASHHHYGVTRTTFPELKRRLNAVEQTLSNALFSCVLFSFVVNWYTFRTCPGSGSAGTSIQKGSPGVV